MRRFEAFLYSRRNIVGSVLALAGLALHFVGLLAGLEWLPITLGLYLIGALLVPAERGLEFQLGAAEDLTEVREGLDRVMRGLRGKVADDLIAEVAAIRASILATLQIEGSTGDAADPNVYLIRQTALTYLPEAFSVYLRLPRIMAERRAIAGGRTPHDALLEQLQLMNRRLADVADDMARHDSDKLLANGRFLAEKFGVSSLELADTLTGGASPPASDRAAAAVPVAADTEAAGREAKVPAAEEVVERERVH
ncbi:MAG TPA: hypothetical protein VIM30_07520 [Candidatus Limnocylindrales bacterium]